MDRMTVDSARYAQHVESLAIPCEAHVMLQCAIWTTNLIECTRN
jgi:hypothetical protein